MRSIWQASENVGGRPIGIGLRGFCSCCSPSFHDCQQHQDLKQGNITRALNRACKYLAAHSSRSVESVRKEFLHRWQNDMTEAQAMYPEQAQALFSLNQENKRHILWAFI